MTMDPLLDLSLILTKTPSLDRGRTLPTSQSNVPIPCNEKEVTHVVGCLEVGQRSAQQQYHTSSVCHTTRNYEGQ